MASGDGTKCKTCFGAPRMILHAHCKNTFPKQRFGFYYPPTPLPSPSLAKDQTFFQKKIDTVPQSQLISSQHFWITCTFLYRQCLQIKTVQLHKCHAFFSDNKVQKLSVIRKSMCIVYGINAQNVDTLAQIIKI